MDFDPIEVARQLTLIEHQRYCSIRPGMHVLVRYISFLPACPEECLNLSWSKQDRDARAPNIVAFIKRFNLVSTWVATEIVKQERLKERVMALKNFIRIAQEMRQMGNFNGVMEVVAGLQNSAIYRLKRTWEVGSAWSTNVCYSPARRKWRRQHRYGRHTKVFWS